MATLPAIAPISNEDLTTKVVNGTGIFDELMTAAHAHLDQEQQSSVHRRYQYH